MALQGPQHPLQNPLARVLASITCACIHCHSIARWDDLQHMFRLHYADQQILALEALQLFAPLGHALGLGAISSRVEDLCFKVRLRDRTRADSIAQSAGAWG